LNYTIRWWCCLTLALSAGVCQAQIFGTVRGTVLDPQHAAIPNAKITLTAQGSALARKTQTASDGQFIVNAVPAGSYIILVERDGFTTISQALNVAIGSAPLLRFSMAVSAITTVTQVTAPLEITNPDASHRPVTVEALEIQHTPGAERTSSLAFITDFVPGSYLLHDHLHMRGGHQVSWLVDGVPVPNTNISSNVGRALDPKDIETVEVSRGGYSSKYGDRTYGMINIVPRSGFEFKQREAELTATYGSLNQSNDQLNFGGHTNRFAYYGSVTGNRTDLGLEPPTELVIHNRGSGLAGFTTLNYSLTNRDQLRLAASLRKDHYQIPNTPEDQAAGVRDIDQEVDSFVNFSWVRALTRGALLTVSPLYHYNRAEYVGGPSDPLITKDRRASNYVGAQATIGIVHGAHNFTAGLYGFVERDDRRFQLADQAGLSLNEREPVTGGVATIFLDEQFKPARWLTLNGGMRMTHFSGEVNENAADPRIGASIRVPKINWVLRGFFGLYYQPPPLETIAGPVLEFALRQGIGFLPVRGERDQQHEFGVTMPLRGWTLDLSHFRTLARDFSDHSVVGNSNITLPLSIEHVTVRGWEAVVHSPEMYRHLHFHLAYSNQVVKGQGAVVGGLTDFAPPSEGFFYVDHDQRDTLSAGGEITLPRKAWMNANLSFGSGFLDGDGPQHLPSHSAVDFALGKSFGDRLSVTFSALNVTNSRYLFGRDSSFAGTHYNEPRQFIGSVRYRFHF
jgi:hypothetical protein